MISEDGSIFHHQIDMIFFGNWEKLIQTYPILEEDPDFDWLDPSTYNGTVRLLYVSSFDKVQCHLLTLNQYLMVLGEAMPATLQLSNLVIIRSGCIGKFCPKIRVLARSKRYLYILTFRITLSFSVIFIGIGKYYYVEI